MKVKPKASEICEVKDKHKAGDCGVLGMSRFEPAPFDAHCLPGGGHVIWGKKAVEKKGKQKIAHNDFKGKGKRRHESDTEPMKRDIFENEGEQTSVDFEAKRFDAGVGDLGLGKMEGYQKWAIRPPWALSRWGRTRAITIRRARPARVTSA